MIERLQAKRNEEGFTLIELLIVIIVLGILAAIVVFAVGNTRKDSVQAACKTDVKSVELSAEAVKTKSGAYPTGTIDATTATNNLLSGVASPDNGALLKAWPSGSDYGLSFSAGTVSVFKDGSTGTAGKMDAGEQIATGCAGLS